MKYMLLLLFIVVGFAFLFFLAIKVAKKDILITRIASLLSILWMFYNFDTFYSQGYEGAYEFRLDSFVAECLTPLVLFWGFAWIANAWIEKRGSNE